MEDRVRSPKPPGPKLAMRTEEDYQSCAARLKALADPDRLRIVNCLFRGPKNVSQLATALGEGLANVSHHLGVLRHAGLVQAEKQGRFVVYRLDPGVALNGDASAEVNTIDLGCCNLDLPKPRGKG